MKLHSRLLWNRLEFFLFRFRFQHFSISAFSARVSRALVSREARFSGERKDVRRPRTMNCTNTPAAEFACLLFRHLRSAPGYRTVSRPFSRSFGGDSSLFLPQQRRHFSRLPSASRFVAFVSREPASGATKFRNFPPPPLEPLGACISRAKRRNPIAARGAQRAPLTKRRLLLFTCAHMLISSERARAKTMRAPLPLAGGKF